MKQPSRRTVSDTATNAALEELRLAIVELQARSLADCVLLRNVLLRSGVPENVQHGMRRVPRGFFVARLPVVGATGRVQTVGSDGQVLVLRADGFGADVVLDLVVF